jgi:hypothetical protein
MYEWKTTANRMMLSTDSGYVDVDEVAAISDLVYDHNDNLFEIPRGYASVISLKSGRLVLARVTPEEFMARWVKEAGEAP